MPLTPRVAALRGRGGGAPLTIAAGDVVRGGTTGGVDGLESGRGILEGESARSMRSEVRMDERSGGAGKSEEEVLTWTGVFWTGGRVATEEEGTEVVEEGMVEEETVVEEEGTVVEAGGMVWVFIGFSMLA